MTDPAPSIEFFEGISENLDDVSLRRNRRTGARSVMMTFKQLKSIERFNSFRNRFANGMRLRDSEGEIQVEPSGVKFIFGGDEGDELIRVECQFEIDRDDHWDRFIRFMDRYAEANGMAFGEKA